MKGNRRNRSLVVATFGLFALLPSGAIADEATGKVVWYDARNSSLLIECPDKGCPQIPGSKAGETYTFVVPGSAKPAVAKLQEGQTVKLVYDDAKEKGYVIKTVK